jgi:hypothetical protein
LQTGRHQIITQPGGPKAGARFGASLASGHFTGSRYADLAISAPDAQLSPAPYSGAIFMFTGGSGGLHSAATIKPPTSPDTYWGNSTGGIVQLAAGKAEGGTRDDLVAYWYGLPWLFQYRWPAGPKSPLESYLGDPHEVQTGNLAIADVNGDGYADLVTIQLTSNGMALFVRPGSASGFGAPRELLLSARNEGMTLAVGDLNRDGKADIVVGEPFESNGGLVRVIYGDSGLSLSKQRVIRPKNVPGPKNTNGSFGETLAVGDINGDGYGDLVIGEPQADLGTAASNNGWQGAVIVLRGAAHGVTTAGAQAITFARGTLAGRTYVQGYGPQLAVRDHSLVVSLQQYASSNLEAIVVIPGTVHGLSTSGVRRIDAAQVGVRAPGSEDGFGEVLLP